MNIHHLLNSTGFRLIWRERVWMCVSSFSHVKRHGGPSHTRWAVHNHAACLGLRAQSRGDGHRKATMREAFSFSCFCAVRWDKQPKPLQCSQLYVVVIVLSGNKGVEKNSIVSSRSQQRSWWGSLPHRGHSNVVFLN